MKVKFNESVSGPELNHGVGDVVDLPEKIANPFIKSGICQALVESGTQSSPAKKAAKKAPAKKAAK